MKTKILVVDDEPSVSRFVRHSLEAQDFKVVEAASGKEGLQRVVEERPDLIVLDFGLPDISGIEVLVKIREWSKVPVIFLTVRDGENDKVAALDAGADDYLTKPFSVLELLARIRVALRHAIPAASSPIFQSGQLRVDRTAHLVLLREQEIKLTATEYAILSVLVNHAGKLVSHRILLRDVWGPNSVEHHHYLRVYFGQIRKKFETALSGAGEMIENEPGVGYRLKLLNPA